MVVIKVDPMVWAEALRISGGERVIKIVNERTVIVTNRSRIT